MQMKLFLIALGVSEAIYCQILDACQPGSVAMRKAPYLSDLAAFMGSKPAV